MAPVNIVHLIYQPKSYEGHAKDYEFSGTSVREHWEAGYNDTRRTLRHPNGLGTASSCTIGTAMSTPDGLGRRPGMKESEIRERAFAMPFTNPAFPPGPYRFINGEFMVITYRSDPQKLRAVVPEPLQLDEPLVKYEFIRMPDSTGFGDYTETGQVIPVSFQGRKGGYRLCMFLNDHPPSAGGREWWGFPKKLANPTLHDEIDTLVGALDYGPVRVATGTLGYKHRTVDQAAAMAGLAAPNFLLKIIPHVEGTPCICQLVEYYLEDIAMKGAWTGPASLSLSPHARAPVAELPVLEVISAVHIICDVTLGLGKVVHDYLR